MVLDVTPGASFEVLCGEDGAVGEEMELELAVM